ncbi:cellulose binding domain-containing protein [Sphaerisporangium sp. B11E5]|uniref:GH12 family glycosyl hydrolase domain-containing protein n=1 Tax=Sphaerisporangium sp. B11E5 TaxID=3153563 RepID=UPI00325DDDC0
MKRHALRVLMAVVAALGSVLLSVAIAGPSRADTLICEKYGSTTINGGRYVVMNNNWGDDTRQCINVTSTGFRITEASHNKPQNGAPGSYPAVYAGCHYANCSSGSSLPMRVTDSRFSTVRTSASISAPSSAGVFDAAYDIWFDPTARTDGQNTGAEIMVWLAHTGQVQPVGNRVGSVNLAGGSWDVWFGNIGWNVISYVRTSATSSIDFNVATFWNDVVSRGYGQTSWYLTSVQVGFEPWVGGTGLAVNNFSYSVGTGGGGDTTAPSAPSNLRSTGVTSNSVTLAWNASSDNVGVTAYEVLRNGSPVGQSSGTSYTVSGLSASTQYSFTVRARDAAGNTSPASNAVSVTTSSGGGSGGSCRVGYSVSQWNDGFTATVTITNTGGSALNGWTLGFTFPGNQRITSGWSATFNQSGTSVTATNMSYNGSIAAGANTSIGFQASYSGTNTAPSSFTLNGAACTVA